MPSKAGEDLPDGCEIEITDDAELRWVSRGGLKLDARADAHCGSTWRAATASTSGQSTGGFTDVLLRARRGARWSASTSATASCIPGLRADPRVTALEGVNARHLDAAAAAARARST